MSETLIYCICQVDIAVDIQVSIVTVAFDVCDFYLQQHVMLHTS